MAAADTAAESTQLASSSSGATSEDDDAWWTSSRDTQATTASAVTGGGAQADSEGSLNLQQQLNALDASAFDQQPASGGAQFSQGGTQPQLQQASLGGLASSGGGADASGYAQPGGTSTRAASTVQPLQVTTQVRRRQ